MWRVVAPVLSLLVLLESCASGIQANYTPLNALGKTSTLLVQFTQGDSVEVRGLHVRYDSASWSEVKTGFFRTVPTSNIRSVVWTSRWNGAKIGACIGFIPGALTLLARETIPSIGPIDPIIPLVLYLAGGIVGGVLGAVTGEQWEIILH